MSKKTLGRLNSPPNQEEFDQLPLERWCRTIEGLYYRLHARNAVTGKPWPAIHFSRKGRTRFDPVDGVGTLYLAETLGGALMETFDDRWGPVGSLGRSLTEQELQWRAARKQPGRRAGNRPWPRWRRRPGVKWSGRGRKQSASWAANCGPLQPCCS